MITAAGVTVLGVGLLCANAAPSSAFDGPNGHHQFVQIVAKGAPAWAATMDLLDANGNLVYHWQVGTRSVKVGGKETWWFTANPGDTLKLHVAAGDGIGVNHAHDEWTINETTAAGDCWIVDPIGYIWHTGNTTSGCTPD